MRIVVVPIGFVFFAEPPDFKHSRVVLVSRRKKVIIAPIGQHADDFGVLLRTLHGSVGLDRRIVELFNVWDWRSIGIDAKRLPQKQTAMNVDQIEHLIL
jgi:hypothetical protein